MPFTRSMGLNITWTNKMTDLFRTRVPKVFPRLRQTTTIAITIFVFVASGYGQSEADIVTWQKIMDTATFKEIKCPRKIDKSLLLNSLSGKK